LISGGAGFVASHLTDRLLADGHEVVSVDSFLTGRKENIEHLRSNPRYEFIGHDVSTPFTVEGRVDRVFHMASPASPFDYLGAPIETMMVGSAGTKNLLDIALQHGAGFLLASTSECYGDPLEHPQKETYWGNVNPVGPRSVYDEAKRFAEALTMAYHRTHGVNTHIGSYSMRPKVGPACWSRACWAL
jgi:dTDP-glucose 4,6-dehydratase